jgi:L-threonylcarbamoyladenylate synthase
VLRVPSHPVAQALLGSFGGGVAAPSANRFGHVSATTAQHVRDEFGAAVELVLDGGQSDVGIESTIVDVTGAQPVLLRLGHISAREIEQAAA